MKDPEGNMKESPNNRIDWCAIGQKNLPEKTSCKVHRILEDTTDFYDVEYGDVLLFKDIGYLVKGTESEKKFGLEGEPKPWVKSCVDLVSGAKKVIKLTFLEEFACSIEGRSYTCLRNPEKESRILEKVKGNPHFMQGFAVRDSKGNNVRILDKIPGTSLDVHIRSIHWSHERYYREKLPGFLRQLAHAYGSMAELHDMGEIHGDITPDHLYVNKESGIFVWIDFDYDYQEKDALILHDILEMGTLLSFVVGKDYLSISEIRKNHAQALDMLSPADMQSVFPNQLANLRVVHKHIDPKLNQIMMRFSKGAKDRYQSAHDLSDDISEAVETITW